MNTEELISLIQQGPEKWNEWQSQNPKTKIIFRDAQFDKNINLSNINFKSEVTFQNTIFSESSCQLENVTFEKSVIYKNCQFHTRFDLLKCSLNQQIKLDQCNISNGLFFTNTNVKDSLQITESSLANLTTDGGTLKSVYIKESNIGNILLPNMHLKGVTLEKCNCEHINFHRSTFEFIRIQNVKIRDNAIFRFTTFEGICQFHDVQIDGLATFGRSVFKERTEFLNVEFNGDAIFAGAQFTKEDEFYENEKEYVIDFSCSIFYKKAIFKTETGINNEKMASTNFSGVKFYGETSFQGRKFIEKTNFGPSIKENKELITEFSYAPNFHECEFHQNTTFHKAKFSNVIGSDEAARAYRTLKLAFQKKYDLRQEQQFYRLEMQEEAKLEESTGKRSIFWIYAFFSDYGFSVFCPFFWFIFMAHVIAMFVYGHSANLEFCNPINENCNLFSALFQFSLSGIPGFERIGLESKKLLFSHELPLSTSCMLVIHKLIIVTGLFLIGLGLRNLFKMK